MSFKFQRFQAIEIDVPSGNTATKFIFPDQPQLTGNNGLPVIIDSVVCYESDALPKSPLTFQDVLTANDLQRGFLTLYQGDLASVNAIPLVELNSVSNISSGIGFNAGVIKQPLVRNLINISWTKSFVQFSAAPTGATKIVFGVYYTVLATQDDVRSYLNNVD